jgi:ComEC/Rec2-related protein
VTAEPSAAQEGVPATPGLDFDGLTRAVDRDARLVAAAIVACAAALGILALPEAWRPAGVALGVLAALAGAAWSRRPSRADTTPGRSQRRGPGLSAFALPALFAALAVPDRPRETLPRGLVAAPILVRGTVVGRVDHDPRAGTTSCVVRTSEGGRAIRLRIERDVRDDEDRHDAPTAHADALGGPGREVVRTGTDEGGLTHRDASTRSPRVPTPGDHVVGLGTLRSPGARRRQGLLPLVVADPDGVSVERPTMPSPLGIATRWRLHLQERLRDAVPGAGGDLLCHLVLGSGPRLDATVVDAHRATGLTHLLAVSGAHATMLAWMLAVAWGLVSRRPGWTRRTWRLGCSVLLVAYGALTGFEAPVVRAVIAAIVLLHATAMGRRLAPWTALAAPALWTAWWRPADLHSIGFCLSYAAVAGLLVAGGMPRPGDGPGRMVLAAVRGSIGAVLATAPWTLLWFGQFAPCTVLLTPLLGPLVALLLALGLLVALVGCVAPAPAAILGGFGLAPATALYTGSVALADMWLPGTPVFAAARPSAPAMLGTAVVFAVAADAVRGRLGAWLGLRPNDGRLRLRVAAAAACLGACVPAFVPGRLEPGLRLLAVGHGQAASIVTADGTSLCVDCGSRGTGARSGRAVVEALHARRRLDLLVISHADSDHFGGVPELLANGPAPRRAIVPSSMQMHWVVRALRTAGTQVTTLAPGERCEVGPGIVVFAPDPFGVGENPVADAHAIERGPGTSGSIGRAESPVPGPLRGVPAPPPARDDNEESLWVRVDLSEAGLGKLLVPGDAGPRAIAACCAEAAAGSLPLEADVLVLPHHGRGIAASLRVLLAATGARVALASNAEDEDEPALVAAARQAGIETATTGIEGDLVWSALAAPSRRGDRGSTSTSAPSVLSGDEPRLLPAAEPSDADAPGRRP